MELTEQNLRIWNDQNEKLVRLSEEFKEIENKFKLENKQRIDEIRWLSEMLSKDKESIKIDALRVYTETKEKTLVGGLKIQNRTKIEYDDKVAYQWAKEHSLCLKLDKPKFNKMAKTQDLDFVKHEEYNIATWPKELKLSEE